MSDYKQQFLASAKKPPEEVTLKNGQVAYIKRLNQSEIKQALVPRGEKLTDQQRGLVAQQMMVALALVDPDTGNALFADAKDVATEMDFAVLKEIADHAFRVNGLTKDEEEAVEKN